MKTHLGMDKRLNKYNGRGSSFYANYKQLNQGAYSANIAFLDQLEGVNSYLIYRDLDLLLSKHLLREKLGKSIRVLDIGCSIGTSLLYFQNVLSKYDYELDILGIDINVEALAYARQRFPDIQFKQISIGESLDKFGKFDLIICNFVLVEMHSDQMLELLIQANTLLTQHGILFSANPTPDIYNPQYDWYGINNRYQNNSLLWKTAHDVSGYYENQTVTLQILDPRTNKEIITFHDFFHSQEAYEKSYHLAGLCVREQFFPLGCATDNIPWLCEFKTPRLRIDILSCN